MLLFPEKDQFYDSPVLIATHLDYLHYIFTSAWQGLIASKIKCLFIYYICVCVYCAYLYICILYIKTHINTCMCVKNVKNIHPYIMYTKLFTIFLIFCVKHSESTCQKCFLSYSNAFLYSYCTSKARVMGSSPRECMIDKSLNDSKLLWIKASAKCIKEQVYRFSTSFVLVQYR